MAIVDSKDTLLSIRNGLDIILEASDKVRKAEEWRAALANEAEALREVVDPIRNEVNRLRSLADVAEEKSRRTQAEVSRLTGLIILAEETARSSKKEFDETVSAADAAEKSASPQIAALEDKERDLSEAEALVEEQSKAVTKSGDLSALLLALQRMNAPGVRGCVHNSAV